MDINGDADALLQLLYDALYRRYQKPRSGTHVSDLTLCPREVVFRRVEPHPIDNTQLGFFTSGEAIGAAIQSLVATDPERFVPEYEVNLEGTPLQGHIDLMDLKKNMPIECKSFNGTDMLEPKPHYISQLKFYMAMTNATKGMILVQILQHFRSKDGQKGKPFKTWVINMTEEECAQTRLWLKREAAALENAIKQKNPALARHIYFDNKLNWKCSYCEYATECANMRLEETKKQLTPCDACGGLFTHKDNCTKLKKKVSITDW